MLDFDKPKDEWDDLDLEDKAHMNVIRELNKLDIDKFVNLYLKPMDPELYEKMSRSFRRF